MKRIHRHIPLLLAACCLAWLCNDAASFAQDTDIQALEERAMQTAVNRVAPAVVRIETFGGLERVGRVLVGTGPTTGVVVDKDGYILSSAFNFVQKPSSILVTLPSGKRTPATIVARDRSRMLVLLKVKTDEKLTVPTSVPRSELSVGQWTIAVGRTFDQGSTNISIGVLSATNRIWGRAIQTDAKVSPSNYGGPLVDIRGRVLGVLVPLSPQGKGEVAGAEWYDSGIGFAVPLSDVMRHLDKLKAGEDLKPGLLGVTLKGSDIYADKPEIAACPAKSPAYEAGIRAGDTIVEVDGKKIVRIAQLRHALGAHYAGDTVAVVATRGEKKIEAKVTLVDELVPYEHAFLGVLPLRDKSEKPGVVVRYVYPDGPAAKAGVMVGDRVIDVDGQKTDDAEALRTGLAQFEPGQTVAVQVEREDGGKKIDVELGRLPVAVPGELPAARAASDPADKQRPPLGRVEVKIPEEKNECIAYVPENYDPDVPYGLLVLLQTPGEVDYDKLVEQWKDLCSANDLILLAPRSADPARWSATEVDVIRKFVEDVRGDYNIDPTRVIAAGHKAAGAMAYLVAFGHQDLVRGVVGIDAPLPRRAPVPSNDPVQRLAFFTIFAQGTRQAGLIDAAAKQLQKAKFPVTVKKLEKSGPLSKDDSAEVVRWIDALDRI